MRNVREVCSGEPRRSRAFIPEVTKEWTTISEGPSRTAVGPRQDPTKRRWGGEHQHTFLTIPPRPKVVPAPVAAARHGAALLPAGPEHGERARKGVDVGAVPHRADLPPGKEARERELPPHALEVGFGVKTGGKGSGEGGGPGGSQSPRHTRARTAGAPAPHRWSSTPRVAPRCSPACGAGIAGPATRAVPGRPGEGVGSDAGEGGALAWSAPKI
jgi:hypothetical protein